MSQYQAVQSHSVIGEATRSDLAGTPVIKSRHGWRPVRVSGSGSAETIKCAVLMVPSVELFATDKCFLSPIHSDEMSLVPSASSWSSPSALSTLMKRVTGSSLDDGCVFYSNELWVYFTEAVGVLISSFPLSLHETENNLDTYAWASKIRRSNNNQWILE